MATEIGLRERALSRTDPDFRFDVLAGFDAAQRAIPARWLYDRRGSELFEAITRLPEYYPTRTECAILEGSLAEIAGIVGPNRAVIEFGSGSSKKTALLLSALRPSAYVPVDISEEFLGEATARLAALFPDLAVHPLACDYTAGVSLPEAVRTSARLGLFLGSTIGNLIVPRAVNLLRTMARTLGSRSMLLIGFDRIKSPSVLIPAYDDAQGVTAAFNLNLLHRINRELAGTIPVEMFKHVALWNEAEARMEMHLEATEATQFLVSGQPYAMEAGERIHTENSFKFSLRDATLLLKAGGWTPMANWTDDAALFSVFLAEAQDAPLAP